MDNLRLEINISKNNSVYFKSISQKRWILIQVWRAATPNALLTTFKFITKGIAKELMLYMWVALGAKKVIFRLGLVFRQPIMYTYPHCFKFVRCNIYEELKRRREKRMLASYIHRLLTTPYLNKRYG